MANTISSRSYRDKYRLSQFDHTLRKNLVAEAICMVDRTDNKRIQSPYGSAPSATVQAIAGTYSTADFTLTDDALTVTDEVIVAEHIYDFESVLTNFDLFASRVDEMANEVATKIDRFVLNNLTEDGTGTYTTPTGGFATAANVNEIFANLRAKVDGYAEAYNGLFVVLEHTDMVGLYQAGATNGFQTADNTISNGKVASWMGVDIYVVRSGTFASETLGTTTYTNSGHRVFGVKKVATYASPRDARFQEKGVSGKTGMEVVYWAYIGFKLWATKTDLIVDITLG